MRHLGLWQCLAGCTLIFAATSHATVYEINEFDGQTFIAMEYLDGETIAEKVRQRPFKIKDAINNPKTFYRLEKGI